MVEMCKKGWWKNLLWSQVIVVHLPSSSSSSRSHI
jgi:hypothetical protein